MKGGGGKIVSPRHLPPLLSLTSKYSWYSFLLEDVSTPGIMWMINSNDTIRNRTRDPPRASKKVELCSINIITPYPVIQFRKLTTASYSTPITTEKKGSQTKVRLTGVRMAPCCVLTTGANCKTRSGSNTKWSHSIRPGWLVPKNSANSRPTSSVTY